MRSSGLGLGLRLEILLVKFTCFTTKTETFQVHIKSLSCNSLYNTSLISLNHIKTFHNPVHIATVYDFRSPYKVSDRFFYLGYFICSNIQHLEASVELCSISLLLLVFLL